MKSNLLRKLGGGVVILVAAGTVLTAEAQSSINGSIAFIGGATLNGPISTATAFSSIFGPSGSGTPVVLAGYQTGAYSSVPDNTPTTYFNVFTFSPAQPTPFPLWQLAASGVTYSFQVTSITVPLQNQFFLDIQGNGVASITGGSTSYTDTLGTWSITSTGVGSVPVFTFGAETTVVPEPSSVNLLLSLMPVVCVFARRFHKSPC
jgi:hypothetical protein